MKKKILFFVFMLSVLLFSINANFHIKAASTDNTLTDLYDAEEYLIGDVAVVTKIKELKDLESIKESDTPPHTAIIKIDKDMNVLDSKGNSINIELKDAYLNYLTYTMPAVEINDMDVADAFIEYYESDFNYLDIFVSSSDPDILNHLRTNLKKIRGILDYSKKTIKSIELGDLVHTANMNFANTIILSSTQATYDVIRYVQSRFKTVWVDIDKYSEINVVNHVANGAYGIVCNEYDMVYEALYLFEAGVNFNRMSYNVAHRGLCISSYENSLEGFIEAYENGATHLEIDVHLSLDDEIVVMHDDTINRTTNGTGKVSSYTAEELEQFKIIRNKNNAVIGEGVKIPLLRDIFEEFKDKEVIFVVEIKTGDNSFCDVFRALLEEYEIMDKTVVISFNTNQLYNMKNIIPEIPTADLNTTNMSTFATKMGTLNNMNAGIDTHYGNTNQTFTRMAALRGYSSWYWTYENEANIKMAMASGVLGITNNSADSISLYGMRLVEDDNRVLVNKNKFEDTMEFSVQLYGGISDEKLEAHIVSYEDHGNYAYAVYTAQYQYGTTKYNIFSDKITLINEDKYIPLDDILEVLSKNPDDLTSKDYEFLEKVKDAYELLTKLEQAKVDMNLVNNLIETKKNQDNNPLWLILILSFATTGLIVGGVIIYIKKKRK